MRMRLSSRLFPLLLFLDSANCTIFDDKERFLQQGAPNRGCGQSLGIVRAAEVKEAGALFLSTFLEQRVVPNSASVVFDSAEYDFEVTKLCSSCQEHDEYYFEQNMLFPAYHLDYCGIDKYGWSATQSYLAFLPVDPETGRVFDKVKLRTFVSLHPSRESLQSAPTIQWPDSLSELVQAVNASIQSTTGPQSVQEAHSYQRFMVDFLPAMVAASAGSAALIPDYAGYGESSTAMNRTVFHKTQYEQAAIVSYLHFERYVADMTGRCTLLDDKVTVQGVEDGAFAAPFVAQAFQRFAIDSVQVFLGAGGLDLETFLMDAVRTFEVSEQDSTTRLSELLQMVGFTYSQKNPGILNTNSSQNLVRGQWRTAIVNRFAYPPFDKAQLPDSMEDLLYEPLLSDIRSNFPESPCGREEITTSIAGPSNLCMAILSSTAWFPLLGLTNRRWIYPLEVCYSDDDQVFSNRHFERTELLEAEKLQALWTRYTGPVASESLRVRGDHDRAVPLCLISPLLFFSLQGHQPEEVQDRGNFRPRLTNAELEQCKPPTAAPTDNPTVAPLPAPTGPPAGSPTAQPTRNPIQSDETASLTPVPLLSLPTAAPFYAEPTTDSSPASAAPYEEEEKQDNSRAVTFGITGALIILIALLAGYWAAHMCGLATALRAATDKERRNDHHYNADESSQFYSPSGEFYDEATPTVGSTTMRTTAIPNHVHHHYFEDPSASSISAETTPTGVL